MDRRSLVRCAVTKTCDWGFKIKDIGEMKKCYDAFRLHCITVHGLSRDDFDLLLHFDLESMALCLRKK
jgi:hypothetical protein